MHTLETSALVIVMGAALAAAALAGCDDGGGAPDGRASTVEERRCDELDPVVTVILLGTAASPAEVIIGAGEVVRWRNDDGHAHTVTSGNPHGSPGAMFGTGPIEPGEEACLRFSHAGPYDYFCELHPETAGRVTVQ